MHSLSRLVKKNNLSICNIFTSVLSTLTPSRGLPIAGSLLALPFQLLGVEPLGSVAGSGSRARERGQEHLCGKVLGPASQGASFPELGSPEMMPVLTLNMFRKVQACTAAEAMHALFTALVRPQEGDRLAWHWFSWSQMSWPVSVQSSG